MTFNEWWKKFNPTIWKAGGLVNPEQVRLLFRGAYLEGFHTGYESSGALCDVCEFENMGVFNNYCVTCGAKRTGE